MLAPARTHRFINSFGMSAAYALSPGFSGFLLPKGCGVSEWLPLIIRLPYGSGVLWWVDFPHGLAAKVEHLSTII